MAARRVHVQAARRSSRPSPLTYGRRRPVSPPNRQAASGHTNMGGGWPSRPSPVAFTVSFGRKGRLKPLAACAHLSAAPGAHRPIHRVMRHTVEEGSCHRLSSHAHGQGSTPPQPQALWPKSCAHTVRRGSPRSAREPSQDGQHMVPR